MGGLEEEERVLSGRSAVNTGDSRSLVREVLDEIEFRATLSRLIDARWACDSGAGAGTGSAFCPLERKMEASLCGSVTLEKESFIILCSSRLVEGLGRVFLAGS